MGVYITSFFNVDGWDLHQIEDILPCLPWFGVLRPVLNIFSHHRIDLLLLVLCSI